MQGWRKGVRNRSGAYAVRTRRSVAGGPKDGLGTIVGGGWDVADATARLSQSRKWMRSSGPAAVGVSRSGESDRRSPYRRCPTRTSPWSGTEPTRRSAARSSSGGDRGSRLLGSPKSTVAARRSRPRNWVENSCGAHDLDGRGWSRVAQADGLVTSRTVTAMAKHIVPVQKAPAHGALPRSIQSSGAVVSPRPGSPWRRGASRMPGHLPTRPARRWRAVGSEWRSRLGYGIVCPADPTGGLDGWPGTSRTPPRRKR